MIEDAGHITLTDEQKEAMRLIWEEFLPGKEDYFNIHGFAGTGKTVLLSHLARALPHAILVAPTGKAADVLRRKTNLPASTIHSVFYQLTRAEKMKDGKDKLEFVLAHGHDIFGGTIALIDESSMVNQQIANDLLRIGVRMISSGDPGQLPPVQGEAFFNTPHFTLRKIHRQALDSPIIRQAHSVRLGKGYAPDGDAFQVKSNVTADDIMQADAILCWKNDTRMVLNASIRRKRGVKEQFPQPGEPVVCLKNAPDYSVYNGGVYKLLREFKEGDADIYVQVDDTEVKIRDVTFEGIRNAVSPGVDVVTRFTLGYALTVHKSQGSEWPNVILIDEYTKTEDRWRWLYTGITRAAQKIIVRRLG